MILPAKRAVEYLIVLEERDAAESTNSATEPMSSVTELVH